MPKQPRQGAVTNSGPNSPELPRLEPRLVKKSARDLLAREEPTFQIHEGLGRRPPLRKPDIHGGLAF